MPERLPTKNPTIIAGTNLMSGTPNTGQIPYTLGGSKTICAGSGANGLSGIGAFQYQAGQGRLDTIQMLGVGAAAPAAASGTPITFYDAAVAGTGANLQSGHKILAILDPRAISQINAALAFNSGALIYAPPPIPLGAPFMSGLCVAGGSGAPGWTATYTPVVSG